MEAISSSNRTHQNHLRPTTYDFIPNYFRPIWFPTSKLFRSNKLRFPTDLGWSLVGPRFGQGLTKMVKPRGSLTSGLTSDVPPYKGFKKDLTSGLPWCQFVWFAYFSRSDLEFNLGQTWGQIPIKGKFEVRPWSDLGSTLVTPQTWPFGQFVWCVFSKLCWPPQFCVLPPKLGLSRNKSFSTMLVPKQRFGLKWISTV
jgi:hypothetical protein